MNELPSLEMVTLTSLITILLKWSDINLPIGIEGHYSWHAL